MIKTVSQELLHDPGVRVGALGIATVKCPTSQAGGAQNPLKIDLKTVSDLDIPCISEFVNWDLYQLCKNKVTNHKLHYAEHHMSCIKCNFILLTLYRMGAGYPSFTDEKVKLRKIK